MPFEEELRTKGSGLLAKVCSIIIFIPLQRASEFSMYALWRAIVIRFTLPGTISTIMLGTETVIQALLVPASIQ